MTRIKICGLTRPEDARLAAGLGAWALGAIFAEGSPRRVGLGRAREVMRAGLEAAPAIERIGVFVDAEAGQIEEAVHVCGLTAVQMHGEESPEFCAEVARGAKVKVIKAFRVSDEKSTVGVVQFDTDMVLLDTYHPVLRGGTGRIFDWSVAAALPREIRTGRLILSGGLTPENIAGAILAVRPYAVDVASGVEAAPGVKDRRRLEALFDTIQNVDRMTR